MPSSSEAVQVENVGDVAVVTFDDGKANALSLAATVALKDAMAAAGEHAGALVLTGRPGFLSAGLDRSVVDGGDAAAVAALMEGARDLYRAMLRSPVPIVVACTGHALAGGALLLLSADLRVGLRGDFKIGLSEVRIGLTLPEFGFTLAERRLDRQHLLRATVLAELSSPDEAKDVGFLDEVVDADVVGVATRLASTLSELPREALVRTRQKMYSGLPS